MSGSCVPALNQKALSEQKSAQHLSHLDSGGSLMGLRGGLLFITVPLTFFF